QLTGPVMAKGLEDTVCYVYNRFVSLNEVGGSLKYFGIDLAKFHAGNVKRAERWPASMLATSTHDTKRSEDVRARLNVLSEMPKLWSALVTRARRLNRYKKITISDGRVVPDFNEEYLLYQTLLEAFLPPIAFFGAMNSLAQTTVKLMAPGNPDIYQGTELWDFSLVDPDNRRPIDFALRRQMLSELRHNVDPQRLCTEMLENYQ